MNITEYLDSNGRSPFARWFDGLDAQAAAKVTVALQRLRQGNLSNVKGVGAGVLEYRVDFGPGYRIYLGKDGEQIVVLLGGGTKRRQQQDIETALDRLPAAQEGNTVMALTREFKDTVKARAARDPAFREALLTEAVELLLSGDIETGKAILRDYINATIGFERLARKTGTPPKSLMRMLGPKGNPRASNLLGVISVLQQASGLHLEVAAR